ncbi:MAG: hypothetical protein ABWX74_16425 [Aeromicrobium sp.]
MTTIRGALTDAISVVLIGLRLVISHLPTLLAIYLSGAAVRNGVIWASVELSADHRTMAGFLLPLAPMATLTAIILMLRHVSAGLSWASFGAGVETTRQGGRYLSLLSSALIPFLTVYAAQGYLKEDLDQFVNEASYDELYGNAATLYGERGDTSRAFIADGELLLGIIVLALVLRFLIGRFDLPARHVTWGMAAAYVEIIWMILVARELIRYQDGLWSWITERRFVDWVEDRWDRLIDIVGPLGRPLQAVADGLGNVLTDADTVLIIPIAWLTVGAIALGQKIETPEQQRRRFIAEDRVKRVPRVVRRVGHEATADIRGRFSGLSNGVRMIALGGLLPMLLFCIVFLVAREAGNLSAVLWRAAFGPVKRDDALAFVPYLDVIATGAYTLVLVGLLAAAIDRIIRRRSEQTDAAGPGSQLSGSSA